MPQKPINPIALVYSDIHINNWKQFNKGLYRLDLTLNLWAEIAQKANQLKIPLLFAGDLFDNPKVLENQVITKTLKTYKLHFDDSDLLTIAISGNHDQCAKSTWPEISPSYLEGFSIFKTFKCLDQKGYIELPNMVIYGIPYLTGNMGFTQRLLELKKIREKKDSSKPHILLIHTDLPKAKDASGFEINSSDSIPLKLKEFFKGFDLIIDGHIHLPQTLNSKTHIIGAPYQQKKSDRGYDYGYYILNSDLSLTFIESKLPRFIEIDNMENAPKDNHFYYEKIKKNLTEEKSQTTFRVNDNRESLAKKYAKTRGIKQKSKIKALIKVLTHDSIS